MARRSFTQEERGDIWRDFFGEGNYYGRCLCCGVIIDVFSFDIGHIVSLRHGGSNYINNLRPICKKCNGQSGMGTMDMREYMRIKGYRRLPNWNGVNGDIANLSDESEDDPSDSDSDELEYPPADLEREARSDNDEFLKGVKILSIEDA